MGGNIQRGLRGIGAILLLFMRFEEMRVIEAKNEDEGGKPFTHAHIFIYIRREAQKKKNKK